jgi:hypothetical protein
LRQVGGFFRLPPTINTNRHNITEILLKVVLSTIILTYVIYSVLEKIFNYP